jgi:hypothetical protein
MVEGLDDISAKDVRRNRWVDKKEGGRNEKEFSNKKSTYA